MSQFDRIEQNEIEKIAKKVVAASGGGGGGSGTVTQVNSGTGLTGGPITNTGTLSVVFGTSGTTACVGNDVRLSDARTPTAHVHAAGDITSGTLNIARIPTGTSASTVCIGNDARLSDARTPIGHAADHATLGTDPISPASIGAAAASHTHAAGDVTSGTLNIARIPTGTSGTTVCIGNDSRLSDARTPLAHTHPQSDITNLVTDLAGKAASSHTHPQSDITNLVTDLAGKASTSHTHAASDIASGVIATARLASSGTADATTFLRGDQRWAVPSGLTVADNDYGDITVSSSGGVWTIDNSTVTVAKINATGSPSATTYLRGDGSWSTPAGGSLSLSRSILTATQANSTTTMAVLTGCSFTLTPGQSITLSANLIFTSAATTTGGVLGVRVTQAASANANATGSAVAYVNIANAAGATGLCDGDVFDVAGGANSLFAVVGTATTAGNNAARIEAVVWNRSTNVNTTVAVEFRSEVGGSAVTAQIGSGAVAIIG
jgi:hypothetical protein